MPDIHRLSATDMAGAIARGEIGSRAALDHFLARIEAIGKPVNAVVAMDIDAARARADATDAAIAAGENWGPLHDMPMTVKDTFEVAGMPTVVSEPSLRDYVSEKDAVVVSRLHAAGAVIFGKTNTPRLARDMQTYNEIYGTTNNPWNQERTSGGYSGVQRPHSPPALPRWRSAPTWPARSARRPAGVASTATNPHTGWCRCAATCPARPAPARSRICASPAR